LCYFLLPARLFRQEPVSAIAVRPITQAAAAKKTFVS